MSKTNLQSKTPQRGKTAKRLSVQRHPSLKAFDDAKLVEIIDYVVNTLIGGFVFGSYTIEDIKQEARCFALQGLSKFDPTKKTEGTLEEKLRSFLFTHIRNRLMNLKRDKQGKKKEKHRLVYALPIDDINDIDEPNMSMDDTLNDSAELNTFRSKILSELGAEFREDYHKMLAGVSLPKVSKDRLIEEIRNIIGAPQE